MKRTIKLIVVDVDGTLTDSGIYYDENGNEIKKFSTRDAAGFFSANKVGIKTMVLTGRECAATKKRMEELKVDYLFQNVKEKAAFLKQFMDENKLDKSDVAYVGDDLNDLISMRLCGYIACPADSCKEVKKIAHYVSPIDGGYGAFRDVIEHILTETGEWEDVVSEVYGCGI